MLLTPPWCFTLKDMEDMSNRDGLLRAAISVVSRGGLRAMTYRAVASEAGVSHGLVRHHFGSRDRLLVEALDVAIAESLQRSNMLSSAPTLAGFGDGIQSLATETSEVQAFQYELLLESRRRPELLPAVERHYSAYRDAIRTQLGLLGVRDEALIDVVWFALDAMVFQQLVQQSDVRPALARLRTIVADHCTAA